MKVAKISDTEIEITKEVPKEVVVHKYDYNFLIAQREAILADLQRYTQARQAELDEVNQLIAKCEELGIKMKEEKDIDEILRDRDKVIHDG